MKDVFLMSSSATIPPFVQITSGQLDQEKQNIHKQKDLNRLVYGWIDVN